MKRSRIESPEDAPPRRGRPRSQEAHTAILKATVSLLREVGYDALALEAVAARAGVGKATLYRHWDGKEALVVEALDHLVQTLPSPDTGSVAEDLAVLVADTTALYREPQTAALLSTLLSAMTRSEAVAHALRTGFIGARRAALRLALERGLARGELRGDLDLDLTLDALAGALLYRGLVSGVPFDADLPRALVALVLAGARP